MCPNPVTKRLVSLVPASPRILKTNKPKKAKQKEATRFQVAFLPFHRDSCSLPLDREPHRACNQIHLLNVMPIIKGVKEGHVKTEPALVK